MRLSGSLSRSNPSGASNFPNDSESADACAGVQLMMRLSISIDVWRSAVRRFEMRRQLAEQVELIGPGPEQAQRELGSERRALREIPVVAGRSHREAGDRERRRLFRRERYLCRHVPPCAAE